MIRCCIENHIWVGHKGTSTVYNKRQKMLKSEKCWNKLSIFYFVPGWLARYSSIYYLLTHHYTLRITPIDWFIHSRSNATAIEKINTYFISYINNNTLYNLPSFAIEDDSERQKSHHSNWKKNMLQCEISGQKVQYSICFPCFHYLQHIHFKYNRESLAQNTNFIWFWFSWSCCWWWSRW